MSDISDIKKGLEIMKINCELLYNFTMDIKDITFKSKSYSICINTSCEHMEQKLIDETIDKMTEKTLVVLQSNDYEELDQHINCVKDLTTFVKQYENKLEKIQAFSLYITKEDYNADRKSNDGAMSKM